MEFNLKKIIKALLLSTSEAVSIKDIQKVVQRYHAQASAAAEPADGLPLEPTPAPSAVPVQEVIRDIIDQVPTLLTATQIREAVDALEAEMRESNDSCRILQGPEGFRLVISPVYADWVRLLRGEPRPQRLSPAALETLSIVAYRQPVTRPEMEAIRGVSVDSALTRLLELELVAVTGRADLPGRPIQYGTTDRFLDFTGLRSLGELPASDVLSPAQISEWIARATAPVAVGDAEVGLPSEAGAEGAVGGAAPPD
ncbi:MAG: SMC-Scp complex subunit ScpB [Verrucomicrobiota bacterium]